ncbi:hypothetical protein AVEN_182149-1 [Araneus ventricosus]|uniref:Uncharacterized protein n=1 Tax=Araneus ventricosus TaxID=182803 RepID=A0A4Y2GPT7_ARAVE|nr:hypothetical protein AVEN_182149-1 [Araneus ventricosus]
MMHIYNSGDKPTTKIIHLAHCVLQLLDSQTDTQKDRTPPHVPVLTTITAVEPVGWTWDTQKDRRTNRQTLLKGWSLFSALMEVYSVGIP